MQRFRSGGARPPTQVIVAYIDSRPRERFGVEPICAELSKAGVTIAPSTFLAHKTDPVSSAALADAYTANALYTLWAENWGSSLTSRSCGLKSLVASSSVDRGFGYFRVYPVAYQASANRGATSETGDDFAEVSHYLHPLGAIIST